MSRGIFGLNEAYNEQVSGDWSTASDVWLIGSPVIVAKGDVGYFAGGRTASSPATIVSSAVHRIDYSNDNTSQATKGPITQARQYTASIASLNYGYTIAGMTDIADTTQTTTIDRLDFANDTETALVRGPLSDGIKGGGTAGSRDYGYYGGGHNHPHGNRSTLSRIDYSNDTAVAAAKGPLALNTAYISATGNQSYGYWSGGVYAGSNQSTVQRLDYSSDSTAAVAKGPLSLARQYRAATGNANFGYFGGGYNPTVSTADRIDYSSDTSDGLAKGPLAIAYYSMGATGNTTQGYWAGGASHASNVQRLDYASDTTAGIERASLVKGTDRFGGMSAAANALGVGLQGAASNTGVNRVPVGTDYGYATGGGVSNPYVNYSIVDRIDYSNDTPTATAKGPLTSIRYKHTAVSSLNHAYMVSGNPGPVTDIDRLDYSNDTTVVTKGTASEVKVDLAAAGTTDYGYIAGGLPVSIVQRIEYANDATSTLVRGPLSAARRYLGGMGTQNYGYFGGGSPGPGYMSTIDRIDYSNDSTTAVAKGPLPAILKSMGSTGNGDFGYWTGGFNTVPGSNAWYSTIQRIDYSNDTTSPAPKGALSVARSTDSTGNTSYGWSLGGNSSNSTPGMLSIVDRIDFSSDTTTAAVKGSLTVARQRLGAVSGQANALPAGEELYTCALSPVNDGSWHHVVMTRVGGTQQTYYDGVGITTTAGTYTDGTNYSGVDGWLIGKGNPSVGVSTFSGNLANITIRKGKGLSSDEVQQNFNALRSRFGV